MELFRKIEELNNLFVRANNILEEAKGYLSQEKANEVLTHSFKELKEETLQELSALCDSLLETKAEAMQSLVSNQTLELFNQNLESLANVVALRVDLNKVAEKTANALKDENDARLIEFLNMIIDGEEFQTILLKHKQKIQQGTQNFLKSLNSINMQSHIYNHIQEFLEQNKEEILKTQDLSFLKETMLTTPSLRKSISSNAKAATKELINKEDIKETLIAVLREDAIRVFEESTSLQELQERRFLSSSLLLNMALQGEVKTITQTYQVLSHLKLEQKRKEALEKIQKTDIFFKTYQVL